MAEAGVSESWITMLGILKAAGALGLLIGISVPPMGTAAEVSLVLFFVGVIITHLRARDYSFGLAMVFLLLAVAALVLRLPSCREHARSNRSARPNPTRRPAGLSRPHRVSVTGAGEDVSGGKGVVATVFLIRYQTVVASRTDINFTRQFFQSSLFIIAVPKNFRNALTKRLRSESALNSPPMANGNAAHLFGDNYRLV
jgi:hypothetical protein